MLKEILHFSKFSVFAFSWTSDILRNIYRAQHGAAMLVYLCDAPTWRPENSVNISKTYFGYLGD